MRNSTQGLEHRELLGGEKQRKEIVELASEHLPQIFPEESRRRRRPPLPGEDIRMYVHSVSRKCMNSFHKEEWYRVGQQSSFVSCISCRAGRFFFEEKLQKTKNEHEETMEKQQK